MSTPGPILPDVGKLTPQQARFVAEYRVDLNATQAAVRAGYSEKTARAQGSRLLTNVDVRNAIDAAQQKVGAKLDVTVERIEAELAKYAFAPSKEAIERGEFGLEQAGVEPKDRLKALELLGKRHKMFTDKVEHSFSEMTDEQLEARKLEIIAAAVTATRPPA